MGDIPPWMIEHVERRRREEEERDNRIPLQLPLPEIPYTSSSIEAPKSTVITIEL